MTRSVPEALREIVKSAQQVTDIMPTDLPSQAVVLATVLTEVLGRIEGVAAGMATSPRRLVLVQADAPELGPFMDPAAVVGMETWMRHERTGTLVHLAGGDTTFIRGVEPREVARRLGIEAVTPARDTAPKDPA